MKLFYITTARIPTEKANGIQIIKMCEAFQKQGVEVCLFVPTRAQPAAMARLADIWEYYDIATRFALHYLPTPDFLRFDQRLPKKMVRTLYYLQCFLFSLRAIARTWRTQDALYYTRSLQTLFLLCLTKNLHGKPVYFEAHELHGDPQKTSPGRLLLSKTMRWMLGRIDGLIVITNRLKILYMTLGIAEQKIEIAPDGVDVKRCEFDVERDEARRQLQIPLDKNIICYTGHLFAWKGVYILAESTRHLSEDCCVYIVGGTEADIQALKDFAAERHLKRLEIVGYVPYSRVPLYLAAADALALPNTSDARISREYTSPLKLFEYMGARRPIVASDLPSIREILRHQRNALLVQPDDPKCLAEGILHVLSQPQLAHELVNRAYTEVRSYTWDARAMKIVRFFRQHEDSEAAAALHS